MVLRAPSYGSKATISIPEVPPATKRPHPSSPPRSISKTRILIVENEGSDALYIQRCLIQRGYQVGGITRSHTAALQQIQGSSIDLVLMGIYPDEGRESAETAKTIYENFQVPVVFLVSQLNSDILSCIDSAHPFGCVVKPFKQNELDAAIRLAFIHSQSERKLKNELAKVKESNEIKSRFISLISHEVRNSLSCIMMTFEVLINYAHQLDVDTHRTHLKRGQNMVRGMSQFLDDILVNRGEAESQFECHLVPTDVAWFCRNLLDDLHTSIITDHRLIFNIESQNHRDFLFYNLDPRLLRHILFNLLSNALKYSRPEDEIHFTLICTSETITFQIEDHGIGIPTYDQSKLFIAFNRATNVGDRPGTGLGLSIVKQCVDAHGGSITLESEVGVGTTVKVSFNAAQIYHS